MDKALELIMVAVILLVASVVVIALLQAQTSAFGNETRSQTNTAGCGIAKTNYCMAHNGTSEESDRAEGIRTSNRDCDWYVDEDSVDSIC
jgi:Tfp pilus assembly protein PilV